MTSLLAVLGAADPSLITVGGLPLHPLAVHAVVVLLPLSVLGLIAIILRPSWRAGYQWLVMGGLAAGTVATIAAVKGGEELAAITGITDEHRNLGSLLQYIAIALLVVAAIWMWQQTPGSVLGKGVAPLAAIAAIGLGFATLAISALVGHSGANAVWANKIAAAPSPSTSATGTVTNYTADVVKQHSGATDCWSIVDTGVYNVTDWINKHPGGAAVIQTMCGVDGSAAFTAQHSGSQTAKDWLASFKIGTLSGASSTPSTTPTTTPSTTPTATPSTSPSATTGYTASDVKKHSSTSNCWTIVNKSVYDVTSWISKHPGGPGVIQGMCGIDSSAAFNGKHNGSQTAKATLASYRIGAFSGSSSPTTKPTPKPSTSAPASGYTAAVVKKHGSTGDCWTIVNSSVYDVTAWIAKHPGGPGVIQAMCGVDAGAAFTGKHSGSATAKAALASYKIGALSGTSAPPKVINKLTLAGVQTHNTSANCWSIVNGNIYNLTAWINRHPGGPGVIQGMCGADASAAFTAQHGNGGEAAPELARYLLGPLQA